SSRSRLPSGRRLRSFHKREPLKAHAANRGTVFEKEVGDFDRAVVGFDHVGAELGAGAGALTNAHAFEGLVARNFDIDHEFNSKFEDVIHGYLLKTGLAASV